MLAGFEVLVALQHICLFSAYLWPFRFSPYGAKNLSNGISFFIFRISEHRILTRNMLYNELNIFLFQRYNDAVV
jgi:hypothetical protein